MSGGWPTDAMAGWAIAPSPVPLPCRGSAFRCGWAASSVEDFLSGAV